MTQSIRLPKGKGDESNPFLTEDGRIKPGILPKQQPNADRIISVVGSYAQIVMARCSIMDARSDMKDYSIDILDKWDRNLERLSDRLTDILKAEIGVE